MTTRPATARGGKRTVKGPSHAPRVPFALLVTGLIVGGLALLLALNTASAANELSHHAFDASDAQVAADVQQLQNEVAASAAPANLARAAEALGMVPAGNPAFIVEEADGTVRLVGSPEAATAAPLQLPPSALSTRTATKKSTTAKKKPAAKKSKKSKAKAKSKSAKTANKKSRKPTSSKSPTARTSPTAGQSGSANGRRHQTTNKPTPTPTPTPTMTLPGGNR